MTTAATYGVGQRPLLKRFARSINHIVTSAHGRWEDLKWLGPFTPERIPMRIRKLMRHDPQLQLGLVTLKSPFFGIEYRVEGGDPVTRRFVQQQILEHPHFPFWLWSILNALDFGFQSHEIMWGIDDVEIDPDASGPKQPISRPASYVYRRILDLDPEAVDVMVDPEFGDFLGVQYINSDAFIPASKTMQAMYRPEWQNWRGKALLDAAYWPWYFASSLYVIMNRHLELKGDPPFIGRAPSDPAYDPTVDFNDEDPEDSLQVLSLAMASLRSSSTCALPSDRDERGNLLWDINEMSLDQRGELFMEAIRHYNDLKLRSLVVPEKTVVQESSVGSFAMVNATVDVFLSNLEVIKQMLVLSTINEQLVKPLVRFNFGKSGSRRMPRVTASELSRQSKQLLSEIVKSVITMPRKALDGKEFTGAALVDLVKALKALNVPTHEVADLPEMQLPNEPPPGAGSNPPGVTTPPPNVGPPEPEPTPEELEKFSSRPKEIAAQWGVSPATVNKWAGRGCPHIRLPGRRFRFNAKLTQGWLRGLPLNQLSLELPADKVIELHLPGQHEQKDHAGGKGSASPATGGSGKKPSPFKGLKGEALDKKVSELLKSSDPAEVKLAKKKKASIAVQKSKAKAKAKLEADLKSSDPAVVKAAKEKIALKKKKASLAVKKSKLKKTLKLAKENGANAHELAAMAESKGFDPNELLPKIGVEVPEVPGPGAGDPITGKVSAPEPKAGAQQVSLASALIAGKGNAVKIANGTEEGGKLVTAGAAKHAFSDKENAALQLEKMVVAHGGNNFVTLKNDEFSLTKIAFMNGGKAFKLPDNPEALKDFTKKVTENPVVDGVITGLEPYEVAANASGSWEPVGPFATNEKEFPQLSGAVAPGEGFKVPEGPAITPDSVMKDIADPSAILAGTEKGGLSVAPTDAAVIWGDGPTGNSGAASLALSALDNDPHAMGLTTLKNKDGKLQIGVFSDEMGPTGGKGKLYKVPTDIKELEKFADDFQKGNDIDGYLITANQNGEWEPAGELSAKEKLSDKPPFKETLGHGQASSISEGEETGGKAVSAAQAAFAWEFVNGELEAHDALNDIKSNPDFNKFVTLKNEGSPLQIGVINEKTGQMYKLPKNIDTLKSLSTAVKEGGVPAGFEVEAFADGSFKPVGKQVVEEAKSIDAISKALLGGGVEALPSDEKKVEAFDPAQVFSEQFGGKTQGLGAKFVQDPGSAPLGGAKLNKSGALVLMGFTGVSLHDLTADNPGIKDAIDATWNNKDFKGFTALDVGGGHYLSAIVTEQGVYAVPPNLKDAENMLNDFDAGLFNKIEKFQVDGHLADGTFNDKASGSQVFKYANGLKSIHDNSKDANDFAQKMAEEHYNALKDIPIQSISQSKTGDPLSAQSFHMLAHIDDDPVMQAKAEKVLNSFDGEVIKLDGPQGENFGAILTPGGGVYKIPPTPAKFEELIDGLDALDDDVTKQHEVKLDPFSGNWMPLGAAANETKSGGQIFNVATAIPAKSIYAAPDVQPEGIFEPTKHPNANNKGLFGTIGYDDLTEGQIAEPKALAAAWKGAATQEEIGKVTEAAAKGNAFEAIVKGENGAPWIKLKGEDGGYVPATFTNLEAVGKNAAIQGSHKGPGNKYGYKGSSGALLAAMQKLGTIQDVRKEDAIKPSWSLQKTLAAPHLPWSSQEFQDKTKAWQQSLTSQEKGLLNAFTGSSYKSIRREQMGQVTPSASRRKAVAALEKKMDEAPKYKGPVWRGITIAEKRLGDFLALDEHEFVAFTSTAREESASFSGNVRLHIQPRTGVSVERISASGAGEREVLFRKGARFRVTKKEKLGSRWNIHMTEITQDIARNKDSDRVISSHELSRRLRNAG